MCIPLFCDDNMKERENDFHLEKLLKSVNSRHQFLSALLLFQDTTDKPVNN